MPEMVTVSTKGQIVIPKKIRKELDIEPGSRIFVSVEDGRIVIEKPRKTLWDFMGYFGKALPPDEELRLAQEGVAKHVLGLDEDG